MISKDAFKLIVLDTATRTGLNQEELATGMGYGKNYISDILSPTGKLTDKFIKAFQAHYVASEIPNQDPKDRTIADLAYSTRTLADNNSRLVKLHEDLIKKVLNLSGTGADPLPDPPEGKGNEISELPLSGKIKIVGDKSRKAKRRGTLKPVNK